MARRTIRFYLNDDLVELTDISAQATLLDFLRLDRALTGTKEGCAEGDCGACTVMVGRLDHEGRLIYEAVNACIRFLATLDGTHLVTIENLAGPAGALHPVQRAMVDRHASQCGFCTPGIVMSLYAHWLEGAGDDEDAVERALQGNLCRCTGYAPILKAAADVARTADPSCDPLALNRQQTTTRLRGLGDISRVELHDAMMPASLDDLAACLLENPGARLVAGATDVALWVNKDMRDLGPVIFLSKISELREITVEPDCIRLGAGVTYTQAAPVIARHLPALEPVWNRIGGRQVRNVGTIGGNIANGSPIGDTAPALMALGATLTLRHGAVRRQLALEDFFIDYGVQDRRAGEFIEAITIPLPEPDSRFSVYKVTKRRDEDITAVLGAFRLRFSGEIVSEATIAYGGLAGVPKRARTVEACLIGKPFSKKTVEAAMNIFPEDFSPLTDWRASADYRMLVARNLLLRFWAERDGRATVSVWDRHHG